MNPTADDPADLTVAARVLGLVERLPHLVGVTDEVGRVLWINAAGRAYLGVDPDHPLTTADLFTDEVFDRYYAEIRPVLLRGETWSGTLPVHRADGTRGTVDAVVVGEVGPGNEIRWLSTLAVDVTEQLEREARLSHLASHDPLTGLPNRSLLLDRLDVAISVAERTGASVAVLALDLDGFKQVNDSLGHAVGDRLLQQVTARLLGAVRPTDTVARMGGDEFVVVVHPPDEPNAANRVAERIRRSIGSVPFALGGDDRSITASVGAALVEPGGSHDVEALLAAADRAMYRAKRHGGNCVRHTQLDRDDQERRVDEIGEGLARALSEGRVVPAYEPVIDLATGSVSAVEVLARWDHPQRGLVRASDFRSAAIATGFADLVWWAAARAAVADARRHALPVPLEIRLSSEQLQGPEVFERVRDLAASAPDVELWVQVSAPNLLEAVITLPDAIDDLRAAGVGIVLAGHGGPGVPLAILTALPLVAVKLDQALVERARSVARAIVVATRFARILDVPCVAPHVERSEDLPVLAVLGVTAVQGPVTGGEWDRARLAAQPWPTRPRPSPSR